MRVLLVRFSAIGDCAMAAHAATCVRRSHPDANLVWAVEERCASVVDDHALATRRAVYPRERWKRGAWSPSTWREQMAFYAALRKERFDIGVDLQGHSKTAICLRLSGAKERLALSATDAFAKILNPVFKAPREARHTVDRQISALRSLGDFPADFSRPLMPSLADERDEMRSRIGAGGYVVIAVGAGQPWKAYPKERWAEVAKILTAMGNQVVFVGGPGESAPAIRGAVDLVGQLDLAKTMAAIADSRLVLAADTGAGHLAAAYGVPVVSIFGPTDPDMFRPYSDRAVVLREGEQTALVQPAQVIQAAEALLCDS